MKKIIFWISWHHNPYNDYLFNSVSKELPNIDLNVFYVQKTLKTHPWAKSTDINHKANYYSNKFPFDIIKIIRIVFSKSDLVIVSGWNNINNFIILSILTFTKKKYGIYTDTPNNNKIRKGFLHKLRSIWLSYILKKSDCILVTGNVGLNELKKYTKYFHKGVNFPFVTDPNIYKRNIPYNFKVNSCLNIFSAGRLLNAHKGFDIAIAALGRFKAKWPTINFKYFIAGVGPDLEMIKNLILLNNLQENIVLLGWISPEESVAYYNWAHIFLHTSHFDPFPNVVLEALNCQTPIIGSSLAGSVVDRIKSDFNGYVFNDSNITELENLIYSCATSDSLLNNMSENCAITKNEWNVHYNLTTLNNIFKNDKN
jgi:hypothetical protein